MTILAPHVSVTRTADGAMLLDERSGRIFHLNTSGHEVLLATLAEDASAAACRLGERYGIDCERARRDVATVLGDLIKRGLVIGDAT